MPALQAKSTARQIPFTSFSDELGIDAPVARAMASGYFAERLADTLPSLPISPHKSHEDVTRVIEVLHDVALHPPQETRA